MNKTNNLKPLLAESDLTEPPDVLAATQDSKSVTRNPQPATRNSRLVTRNPQPVTRTSQRATRNPYLATRNPHPVTRNAQPVTRNADHEPCYAVNLGMIDYNQAWKLQSDLVAAKISRRGSRDIILFLEHPAVFTLGRRGGRDHLLVSKSFLKQSGIPIIQVERGGYITFHGPGQLVVYFIINLEARRLGVTDFVKALEEIMLRTVGTWGLTAQRNNKNPGIWMGDSKMGSIGIALRKGISFHGLALNVNVDLTPFSWIQPCGLQGVSMTSVKQELGQEIPMDVVRNAVKENLKSELGLDLNDTSYLDLRSNS